jgi:CarboxypepD_reg-like domain
MKNQIKHSKIRIAIFFLFISGFAYGSANDKNEERKDSISYNAFQGIVTDSKTNEVLPFATIEAMGSNLATVTNIDGEFLIKVGKNLKFEGLKISYVGYKNQTLSLDEIKKADKIEVSLQPTTSQIKEIDVRPSDATTLINDVLNNISKNYSNEPMMMKGFYRETIKNGNNYVSISEAVLNIEKEAYTNASDDKVKIEKGRKSANVKKMDTLIFKLQGGPAITVLLDIVKNPYILLSDNYQDIYDFYLSDVVNLNDKLHYVVSFQQKPYIDTPLYFGKLYIEMERLAITEAEFELNLENKEEASNYFIQKKPIGMIIIPEKAVYRTSYTIQDNEWYFSYARAEAKFKVNWKKKLFNTNYSTMSEIAITDKSNDPFEKINRKQSFKRNDIMDEKVFAFFDTDYWGEHNVIEPDESIDQAIRKLNRKFR